MVDESVWKKRFALFMAARLFGLLTFLAGVAIFYSDLLRPGGWPAVGSLLIIFGIIDAVFAPKLMKKHWQRLDSSDEQGPIS
ncbi:MAG: hypothetical protein H0T82_02015 [Sphingomonas sp.]|nr:hypothetical protein [Sphingomonas sp.]